MVLRKNLPIIEEDESKMKSSIVDHDSDESDEASAVNRHQSKGKRNTSKHKERK